MQALISGNETNTTFNRRNRPYTYLVIQTVLGHLVVPEGGTRRLQLLQRRSHIQRTPIQMADDDATFGNLVEGVVKSDGQSLRDQMSRTEAT